MTSRFDYQPDYPHAVDKHRQEQVEYISTWPTVPESQPTFARMTSVNVVPKGSYTETIVNPLDYGMETVDWYEPPMNHAPVVPAGRIC